MNVDEHADKLWNEMWEGKKTKVKNIDKIAIPSIATLNALAKVYKDEQIERYADIVLSEFVKDAPTIARQLQKSWTHQYKNSHFDQVVDYVRKVLSEHGYTVTHSVSKGDYHSSNDYEMRYITVSWK